MIFPLAFLALTSSITAVLIFAGLAGRAGLAAELAVIQGALIATFYAFSGSARSLILQGHGELTPERLLAKRIVALPLLCAASYVLCAEVAGVSPAVALLVIARRACEWLAEVRLCEIEVARRKRLAAAALAFQSAVTLAAALALAFAPGWTLPALAAFAVSPLLVSTPRPSLAAFRLSALRVTLRSASLYVGSTVVEGASTYVLRLVVFFIAGRETSGLLFTAFVLGSFAATLFANVFGPTLALSRTRNAGARHGAFVAAAGLGMGALGIAIAGASLAAGLADWLGRPGYFWLALGFSLVGGAVMFAAQAVRLRLFDEQRADILFGPDVLRNIAAIIAAPSLYFLVGPSALGALYLLTALLTLVVYASAARYAARDPVGDGTPVVRGLLAAALLLPLFFMLDGRIYRSPGEPLADAGGVMGVPLPLSLPACFAGILLLARYRQAMLTQAAVFFLFVGMVLASVLAAQGDDAVELRKFVLLFQFLVPALALVLGEMFGASQPSLRATALGFAAVLAAVVPLQLARSLHHDLWLFSIYQHRQYVPDVVAAAFLVALFALWEDRLARRLLVAAAPLVAAYAVAAQSGPAIALLAVGAALLAALRWREPAAALCALLVAAALAICLHAYRDAPAPPDGPARPLAEYWQLYADGIAGSAAELLLGHAQVMDRAVAPSAYNYYLDFVYNFGVLAFLPFAWLAGHTLRLLWRRRGALARELPALGLALGVLFVLALDNLLKVPLRQPYSGVFFFFLWGLLLARLQALPSGRA